MSSPDAPAPPDYTGAAVTEGDAAIQAALINQIIGQPTQITPFGTYGYEQTGTTVIPGVGERPEMTIPTYTATSTLSPEQQQLYDMRVQAQTGALEGAMGALSEPFSLEGLPDDYYKEGADAYYAHATGYLDPQFEREQERLETDLINRGFSVGDEGYTNALDDQARREQAAYESAANQAIVTGSSLGMAERQQGVNEAVLERNQPLAELSSISTGAAPVTPTFATYPTGTAQPPNLLGATQAQGAYNQDVYNADVGTYNAMLGTAGMLGAAGMAAYAAPSVVMF